MSTKTSLTSKNLTILVSLLIIVILLISNMIYTDYHINRLYDRVYTIECYNDISPDLNIGDLISEYELIYQRLPTESQYIIKLKCGYNHPDHILGKYYLLNREWVDAATHKFRVDTLVFNLTQKQLNSLIINKQSK